MIGSEALLMKIKEHSRTWPPRNGRARTGHGDIVAVVDLDDVVLTAQRYFLARDHIGLRLRKNDGLEYGIELVLPENVVDKVVAEIATRDLKLREVGDLDIL
jgi:hypothetical protein